MDTDGEIHSVNTDSEIHSVNTDSEIHSVDTEGEIHSVNTDVYDCEYKSFFCFSLHQIPDP